MTDPAAARDQGLKCPQPGGEAVADRDKSDRCRGDTPSSGERLRDEGQAGRSGEKSPILSPETIPADPAAANTATRAWLRCPRCGAETNEVHGSGCPVCAPYVPAGTPGSAKVTWWAQLNPQTFGTKIGRSRHPDPTAATPTEAMAV